MFLPPFISCNSIASVSSVVVLLEEAIRERERLSAAEGEFDRLLCQEREARRALEVRMDALLDERYALCTQHALELELLQEKIDSLQKQHLAMKSFVQVDT